MACNFKLPVFLALAFAGILATAANAASVTYAEVSNNGTRLVTDTSNNVTPSVISSPYGPGVVTPQGSGLGRQLFTTLSNFNALANYNQNVASNVMDGKLDFSLTFDSAVNVTFTLNESGTWATSSGGANFLSAGGQIHTPSNNNPISGAGNVATTFNTDGTWSGTAQFSSYIGAFSVYNFSVDNFLDAEAPIAGSSASLVKNSFSITITIGWRQRRESHSAPTCFLLGGMGLCGLAAPLPQKLARAC